MRTRTQRVMFVADSHGRHVDPTTECVARKFMDEFRPDLRYHLGDAYDLATLRKNASVDEQRADPAPDIEAGHALLDWYKPTHFVEGNHDWRVRREFEQTTDATRRDWCRRVLVEIQSRLKGVDFIGYDKDECFTLGRYRIVHGITHGKSALTKAAQLYGPVIMGHIHVSQTVVLGNMDRDRAHSVGCLANPNLDYNRADPGSYRHNTGFAYGLLMPDDTLVFQHAQQTDGRWFIPTDFKEFK